MLLLITKLPLKTPTAIDSLKHSLVQMQHKVDSLEKVVMKTEIGTGFFSEVIALQLGVFLFLVSIAGWVAWGSFFKLMRKYIKSLEDKFTKAVGDQEKLFNDETAEIKQSLWRTTFNVNRAMYKALLNDTSASTLFYWALSATKALFIWNPKKVDLLTTWLEFTKEQVDHITEANSGLRVNLKEDIKTLENLKQIQNLEVRKLVTEIESRLYQIVYPTLPHDGLDDNITSEEERN